MEININTMQNDISGKNIRVLMLTEYPYTDDDYFRGGVINAAYWLVQGLSKIKGLELYILVPCKVIKKEETRTFGNTKIIYFPPKHIGYDPLLLYSGLRSSVADAIKKIQPDIIHGQGNADYLFTSVNSGIPHVETVHGIFKNEFNVAKSRFSVKDAVKKIFTQNAEKYYVKRIESLIAITKEVEDFVKYANPDVNVFRINNAIDDSLFNIQDTSDSSNPIILFVAAITYRKGLHMLMDAFEQLLSYIPQAQMRIAGIWHWDPDYVQNLMKKHAKSIECGSIHFLGGIPLEALYEEFSQCSVFCLPSLAESAPMVIAQALAAGKPVIASRVGGIPDMINNGVTGYLVESGNTEELHNSLKNVLSDKNKLKEMGVNARLLAKERYSSSAVAFQTMHAYNDVLNMKKIYDIE